MQLCGTERKGARRGVWSEMLSRFTFFEVKAKHIDG
jgi:hypothetical protein